LPSPVSASVSASTRLVESIRMFSPKVIAVRTITASMQTAASTIAAVSTGCQWS
jgi:hypothetical protein